MAREPLPGGQDLGDAPSDRLALGDARDRRDGGVPVADAADPVEQDDAVADVLERERRVRATLRLAVEAGVVDGDGGPRGELLGDLEVGLRELPRAPGR